MSEVYKWLKNLPGGLHLEKCCKEFESRGFHTLGSLKYLRPGDIDAFFPSPEKLLLAEKRILESEINAIVNQESKRTPLRPLELSQRFNSFSGKNYDAASSYDSQMSPSNLSPLLDISPPTITTTPQTNFPDPSNCFFFMQMLKGYRKKGQRVDTRLPITLPILHKLVDSAESFSCPNYTKVQFCAMCSLAFYAFLRVGEMTAPNKGACPPIQLCLLILQERLCH